MCGASVPKLMMAYSAIRTVSGIRGQIKKPLRTPEGAFRATFEDKLVKSDIVFLRGWVPVEPAEFYNPVTNLLEERKGEFEGMKTVFQLRKERSERIPLKKDSLYQVRSRTCRVVVLLRGSFFS